MKNRLIAFVLSVCSAFATNCTLGTGATYTTFASTSGLWGGGCGSLPTAGDGISLSGATILHIASAETPSIGSTTALGYSTVSLTGTSKLIIDNGGTLTDAAGNNSTSLLFTVASGSTLTNNGTLLGNVSGDYSSFGDVSGAINGTGTFSVPAANYSWAVQITSAAMNSSDSFMDQPNGTLLYSAVLDASGTALWPVSNAGGTNVGSFGNTSLSFASVTPSGALVTEVSSIAAVLAHGQYYVDYNNGMIITPEGISAANATYKSLTGGYATGWGIKLETGSTVSLANATFKYMGRRSNAIAGGILTFTGVPAAFNINGATFQWGYRTVEFDANPGSLNVVIDSITHQQLPVDGGGFVPYIASNNTGISNVTLSNTHVLSGHPLMGLVNNGGFLTSDHVVQFGTWGVSDSIWASAYNAICSDCAIYSNGQGDQSSKPLFGLGRRVNGFFIVNAFGASSGHPFKIYNNSPFGIMRFLTYGSHVRSSYNKIYYSFHHGFVAASTANLYITDTTSDHDLIVLGVNTGADTGFTMGYNFAQWLDNVSFNQNAYIGGTTGDPFVFGDSADPGAQTALTLASMTNNVNYPATNSGTKAMRRVIASSDKNAKVGATLSGNNVIYNTGTAYTGYTQDALFTLSGTNYNTASKNVTGSTLWNPTYPTTQTTGALKHIRTSATNITDSWSIDNGGTYGTPVQLVFGGSGTSYAIATIATSGSPSTAYAITVAGTPYSTTNGNVACPFGMWAVITSGAALGSIGMITTVTSTSAIVVTFPTATLSPAPVATDAFVIYNSEVTLLDAAAAQSVNLQMDPRTWPSSNGTTIDTGIGIKFPSFANTVNPRLGSGSLNNRNWSLYFLGSIALSGVSTTGGTPGPIIPLRNGVD